MIAVTEFVEALPRPARADLFSLGECRLTLVVEGHRSPPGDLHVSVRWRNGRRPSVTVCGAPVSGFKLRLTDLFRGWPQVLCPGCRAWMDEVAA